MADDPQFSGVLCLRSNVDLKDEWRNVSVMANGWGSRERARLALKRTQPSHKRGESSIALSTISQSDEEMADPSPLASSGGSSPTDCPKRAIMRTLHFIGFVGVTTLGFVAGSHLIPKPSLFPTKVATFLL